MNKTQNLGLGLLEYNQAQKEILINEAINIFDSLFAKTALSIVKELPVIKSDGEVYIISAGKYQNCIALYANGWRYITPKSGWKFWVHDKNCHYIFDKGEWRVLLAIPCIELKEAMGEVTLDFSRDARYKITLEGDIKFNFKEQKSPMVKIELVICAKNNIKTSWGSEVIWSNSMNCQDIQSKRKNIIQLYSGSPVFGIKNTF